MLDIPNYCPDNASWGAGSLMPILLKIENTGCHLGNQPFRHADILISANAA